MSHDPLAPVQYRLRHAGIAVTCTAIALAIAAPWLRTLPLAKWATLGMAVGVIAAAAFAVGIGLQLFRRAALAKAGKVYCQAWLHGPANLVVPGVLLLLAICQGTLTLWLIGAEDGGLNMSTGAICASAGCIAAIGIANPCYVLITDNGLLVNLHFYPWRQLSYAGTDDAGDVYVKVGRAGVFYIRCADEGGRGLIEERAGAN